MWTDIHCKHLNKINTVFKMSSILKQTWKYTHLLIISSTISSVKLPTWSSNLETSLYLYNTDPKVAVLDVSVDERDRNSQSISCEEMSEKMFDNFSRVFLLPGLSNALVCFAMLYLCLLLQFLFKKPILITLSTQMSYITEISNIL